MTTTIETTAADLWRLAEEADRRGVRILLEPISGDHFATSSSDPAGLYRVTAFSCTCKGFMRWQRCTHHAALLAHLGWLPDSEPDPLPPAPVATLPRDREQGAAIPASMAQAVVGPKGDVADPWTETTGPAGCSACGGNGYVPTPLDVDGKRRWAATPCAACAETVQTTQEPPATRSVPGELPAVIDLGERGRRADGMKQAIDAAVERLAGRLAAGHSADFLAAMRFFSRFHKYSWNNALLILAQKPDATRVAGMKRWNELGYRVRAGEKALWIWAPICKKELDPETGEKVEVVVGFRPAAVWDAGQLDGIEVRPLPEPTRALPDDAEPLYRAVKARIEAQGIAVVEGRLPAGIAGVSEGGRIRLQGGLGSRERLFVLLHEYVHELAHHGDGAKGKNREQVEFEAEAAAFVVGAALGYDNPNASDYLLSYEATAEGLRASLGTIQRLVRRVLTVVEPAARTEESVAA